ncbi:MAG: type I glutamate--ammonia ligase, partial [Calditrichia bacterium]|nr:type I glutamate--ammonia ligase [Calditrichia bacterium]
AIKLFEKDKVLTEALGEHISKHFIQAKLEEWHEYLSTVHQWEVDRYLSYY